MDFKAPSDLGYFKIIFALKLISVKSETTFTVLINQTYLERIWAADENYGSTAKKLNNSGIFKSILNFCVSKIQQNSLPHFTTYPLL